MIRWTRCYQWFCLILLAGGCHTVAPPIVVCPASERMIFKYFEPVYQPFSSVPVALSGQPAPSIPAYEELRQERLRLCIARFHATDPAERDALFFQIDAIDELLAAHYAEEMSAAHKRQALNTSQAYSCTKKYCSQVTTCDEAYYLLNTCKVNGLDRDQDGVPCENLCK